MTVSGKQYLDGEQKLTASPEEVLGLLEGVLERHESTRNVALTAIMKLSARFPDQGSRVQVLNLCKAALPRLPLY